MTATRLLQLYNTLSQWFGPPLAASPPQHVVELPYLRSAVAGESLLGFANRIDRQVGWAPITVLDLAVPVTSAWLSDRARWPEGRLSKTGLARSYEIVCGHPDGADQKDGDCEFRDLGGVNPQARFGRWVEEVEWQSNTTPLRQSFAVIIAQGLFMDVTGDQAYIDRQRDKWDALAAESRSGRFVWHQEFPVGAFDDRDNCSLAHFVSTLDDFNSVAGRQGMVDLVVTLSQKHPPGGRAVTEESIMQILQHDFEFVWDPSESAC